MQWWKGKRKTIVDKIPHRILKIDQHERHLKVELNACAPEEITVPRPSDTALILYIHPAVVALKSYKNVSHKQKVYTITTIM